MRVEDHKLLVKGSRKENNSTQEKSNISVDIKDEGPNITSDSKTGNGLEDLSKTSDSCKVIESKEFDNVNEEPFELPDEENTEEQYTSDISFDSDYLD